MVSNSAVARAYYEAAEGRNGAALIELLHPNMELRLTEGLPVGLGGTYRGRDAALGALRRAAETFDPVARPERFLSAEEDEVIVLGRYIGRAGMTGRSFEAAFVHVLCIQEGSIVRFTQVTDSYRWSDALVELTSQSEPATR